MTSGRTLVSALVGAVVGVVFSFVPLSTVIGGAVAGFLEGPDVRRGALVGALAGLITFLPLAGIAVLVLGAFGVGLSVAAIPAEGVALVAFVLTVALFAVFVYTVVFAALGGYLGAYLAREYPDRHRRTRETIGLSTGRRSVDPTQPPRPGARGREPERSRGRGDDRGRDDGGRDRY